MNIVLSWNSHSLHFPIRWDFTATSDWLPLFTSGVPNPNLPSVQPTQLQLSTSDERAAKILKERIEKTLRYTYETLLLNMSDVKQVKFSLRNRASLMHLRKKMGLRTTMNFQGNSVLKKLLPGLEARRGGLADEGGGLAPVSDGTELDRLSKSHKVGVLNETREWPLVENSHSHAKSASALLPPACTHS